MEAVKCSCLEQQAWKNPWLVAHLVALQCSLKVSPVTDKPVGRGGHGVAHNDATVAKHMGAGGRRGNAGYAVSSCSSGWQHSHVCSLFHITHTDPHSQQRTCLPNEQVCAARHLHGLQVSDAIANHDHLRVTASDARSATLKAAPRKQKVLLSASYLLSSHSH